MNDTKLSIALGKVLIAIAWANGTMKQEERSFIVNYLFNLPDISDSDRREFQDYLRTPIEEAERVLLLHQLRRVLKTSEERTSTIHAIQQLFIADGSLTPEKWTTTSQVIRFIQGSSEDIIEEINGTLERQTVSPFLR